MHPLLWLQRLFMSPSEEAAGFEDSPVVWTQHLRIIIAIVVVIVSAIMLWWILM